MDANVQFARGNPDQVGLVNIDEHVAQTGPWHLLLRAHDHIWKSQGWPFLTRYEASQLLWKLSIPKVNAGESTSHYCETAKQTVLYPKSECGCAIGLREE